MSDDARGPLPSLQDLRVPGKIELMDEIDGDTQDDPPPPVVPAGELPIGKHTYENLSGTAGTGKTYLSKALIASQPKGRVMLAATTGIAAVNLGEGTTINAALKYFDTESLKQSFLGGILPSILRKHRRCGVQRLLIDEKSMMWGEQLTYIVRANEEIDQLKRVADAYDDDAMKNDDEFAYERAGFQESKDGHQGPLAITLVGDFGQLPPIPPDDPRTGKKMRVMYAFDSPEWNRFVPNTTQLTKIWRQDAQDFVQALQAVRSGDVTKALAFFTPSRFSDTTDDQFDGTTIFAKNVEVDRYNQLRLDALQSKTLTAKTAITGKPRGDWANIPIELKLKEGALVMILANMRRYEDEEDSRGRIIYANGDLGHLIGEDENGNWVVKLHRTNGEVAVSPIHRENAIPLEPGRKKQLKEQFGEKWIDHVTEDGRYEVVGTIDYMPMRAAYGCTVHKTQGLTLDKVQVNTRDPFFKYPGMLFVALSRCRTAEGLRVIGNQMGFLERCKVEPRVQPWL